MNISLKQPQFLHNAGRKLVNEDFIYPVAGTATNTSNLFIVSDGDRGTSKNDDGNTAAQMVAMGIATHFGNVVKDADLDLDQLEQGVTNAAGSLMKYLMRVTDSEGISASFALVHFGTTRVTLAWLGDSRVYYYNSHLKQINSSDQWDQDLGTPEPHARINGVATPPKVRMKYFAFQDLHPGDYFFLASSGMDQEINSQSLKYVFGAGKTAISEATPEELLKEISNLAENGSLQENYSCYLIPVAEVTVQPTTTGTPQGANATTALPVLAGGQEQDREDRLSNFLKWGFGGALAILVVTLLVIAFLESRDKPFQNLMAQGDSLLQAGGEANLNSNFSLATKEFRLAGQIFDSAATLASTASEKKWVDSMQNRLSAFMATNNPGMELEELPLDQLTLTPSQYLKNGNKFMEEGNHFAALQAFRNAQRLLKEKPDPSLELPKMQMAEAYLRVGNALYLQDNRNCELILDLYDNAYAIYQPADSSSPNWFQQADVNREVCKNILAAADTSTRSRGLPSASDFLADATREPVSNPSAANRRQAPPSMATTPPAPANNSAASTANQRTRGMDPAPSAQQMADLKRNLSDGKRQYIEAKEQNSAFLYRSSADKLERAGKALDGPGAYLLAYMYHSGLGVANDEAKALQYAQQSARANWPAGQYLYGFLLLERRNHRDTTTAVVSLRNAASQFYNDAVIKLDQLGIPVR